MTVRVTLLISDPVLPSDRMLPKTKQESGRSFAAALPGGGADIQVRRIPAREGVFGKRETQDKYRKYGHLCQYEDVTAARSIFGFRQELPVQRPFGRAPGCKYSNRQFETGRKKTIDALRKSFSTRALSVGVQRGNPV